MTGLPRPCLKCGEPNPGRDYCETCRPKRTHRPRESATRRGYGYRWEQLSKRARALQPFCTDCGKSGTKQNPLSVDHSPAAWDKVDNGGTLTLKDFENGVLAVVCTECNKARGNARGVNPTHSTQLTNPSTPRTAPTRAA